MTPVLARGLVQADGLVLDVELVGQAEARSRVLHVWREGCSLHDLGGPGWLLVLAEPASWRAHLAPGLVLQRRGGALVPAAAPPLDAPMGSAAVPRHGAILLVRIEDLDPIDPARWISLDGLVPQWLEPLDGPPPALDLLGTAPPPVAVDLRSHAGIGSMSDDDERVVRELLGAQASSEGAGGRAGEPGLDLSAVWERIGRILGPHLVARHQRYLNQLRDQLERGELDDALRKAIPLGGQSTGLTFRLPRSRPDLRPAREAPRPGPSVPYGLTIEEELRLLYRRAADQLEGEGRLDEAAFVHADLLRSPAEAVGMLERHLRWQLAAELAETHRLDPALRVRLWWRAGERQRAVNVARMTGCFAAAVARLHALDPERAVELRALWVEERRAAGDLLGAVEAAWPAPQLRASVAEDIVAGLALAGTAAPRLLAHLLAAAPRPDAADAARNLLAAPEAERGRGRAALVSALADLPAADPVLDRELASAATRALLAIPPSDLGVPDQARRRLAGRLLERADPLLAADLPPPSARGRTTGALEVEARPGATTGIHDAVALDAGPIVVALGEEGVLLLRPNGALLARWDTPAHRVVPADHGGRLLLLADRESAVEVSVLDLATRRIRPVGPLRLRLVASSFDGALWIVADEQGLAVVDLVAPRPTVVWRELDPMLQPLQLERSPTHLSATVAVRDHEGDGPDRIERLRWLLPAMTSPIRTVLPADGLRAVTASSELDVSLVGQTTVLEGFSRTVALSDAPVLSLLTDADAFALVRSRPPGLLVLVGADRVDTPLHTIELPGKAALGLRRHGETVTVWTSAGQVVALNLRTAQLAANLHVPR